MLLEVDARPATELDRVDWTLYAACRGEPLETFFPPPSVTFVRAAAICSTCRVRDECLASAVNGGGAGSSPVRIPRRAVAGRTMA